MITLVCDQFQASCSGDRHFVLMLFNLVLIIVKPHSVTNVRSKGELIATYPILGLGGPYFAQLKLIHCFTSDMFISDLLS